MTADVITFPSRARPRAALPDEPQIAGVGKWFDTGLQRWIVATLTSGGDPWDQLGVFVFENEADRRVARWMAEHGFAPGGAA